MTNGLEHALDREVLDRVDSWRSRQSDHPSLVEAVQRLVDVGLSVSGQGGGNISEGEKLILCALRDLWQHQNVDVRDGIDLEFVCEMVSARHEWALEWKYPGIFNRAFADPPEVSEVLDILQMWDTIERSYEGLSEGERNQVEKVSSGQFIRFIGFSINDEIKHYSAADILINRLEGFDRFKQRELNSHGPYLGAERRMLDVFKRISPSPPVELSVADIINLLKARIHPDSRES